MSQTFFVKKKKKTKTFSLIFLLRNKKNKIQIYSPQFYLKSINFIYLAQTVETSRFYQLQKKTYRSQKAFRKATTTQKTKIKKKALKEKRL